jgi:hypothetical protein
LWLFNGIAGVWDTHRRMTQVVVVFIEYTMYENDLTIKVRGICVRVRFLPSPLLMRLQPTI